MEFTCRMIPLRKLQMIVSTYVHEAEINRMNKSLKVLSLVNFT